MGAGDGPTMRAPARRLRPLVAVIALIKPPWAGASAAAVGLLYGAGGR